MVISNEKPLTFYTDRSAAELDDKCGMAFYFNRIAGGKGIVPRAEAEALEVGRITHEDLSLVGAMKDISPEALEGVVRDILAGQTTDDLRYDKHRAELLYRRVGWLVAFALYVEPKIREIYDNESIEKEIALDRDPLVVGITPDRLLRNKKSKRLVYREYKSTVSGGSKWLDSWKSAIQIHTSLKAVEEEMGEKPAYAQVMGLMKGYYSTADRRLVHPYVYGYYNRSLSKWSAVYMSGAAWEAMPVWEYPGGVVKWIQFCGEEEALRQFPHTEPIFLNEEMVEKWVARRVSREKQIEIVKDMCVTDTELRAIIFEQRTNKCRPAFGDACEYRVLCWNATWDIYPEKHPDFVPRTPHHDLEMVI